MSRVTDRLGEAGERYAARYLEERGLRIVERNARRREGEIDIVATDDQRTVFGEVKLRRPSQLGGAVQSLSES